MCVCVCRLFLRFLFGEEKTLTVALVRTRGKIGGLFPPDEPVFSTPATSKQLRSPRPTKGKIRLRIKVASIVHPLDTTRDYSLSVWTYVLLSW